MKDFKLYGWEKDIISAIDSHLMERESEAYQGLPEYVINKDLSMTVSLPRRSGHTTFASYLASKYPSLVVYSDIKHYLSLSRFFELNAGTDMISRFEIFFALNNTAQTPNKDVEDLRERFLAKKVVVVDQAESLPQHVRSFLVDVCPCALVFLGK